MLENNSDNWEYGSKELQWNGRIALEKEFCGLQQLDTHQPQKWRIKNVEGLIPLCYLFVGPDVCMSISISRFAYASFGVLNVIQRSLTL